MAVTCQLASRRMNGQLHQQLRVVVGGFGAVMAFLLDGPHQPLEIGDIVFEGRRFQDQEAFFHRRRHLPGADEVVQRAGGDGPGGLGLGLEGLAVFAGRGGDGDHQILDDRRLAGQAKALGVLLAFELHGLVGGNLALFDLDLALAANPVAAAGGLDIDPGLGRGAQQVFAGIHLDGDVVGQEGNGLFHGSPVSGEVLARGG